MGGGTWSGFWGCCLAASHHPPRLSIIGHSELRMIPIKRAIGKYLFDSYDARKKEIVTSLRDTDQIFSFNPFTLVCLVVLNLGVDKNLYACEKSEIGRGSRGGG